MSSQPPNEPTPKKDESFFDFLVRNKWETLAYIVLIFGILLFIFERFAGGLLVGAILGLYYSHRIRAAVIHFKEDLTREGIFHGFILVATFITLFIAAPGLFIGSMIGAFVRPYFIVD